MENLPPVAVGQAPQQLEQDDLTAKERERERVLSAPCIHTVPIGVSKKQTHFDIVYTHDTPAVVHVLLQVLFLERETEEQMLEKRELLRCTVYVVIGKQPSTLDTEHVRLRIDSPGIQTPVLGTYQCG